MRLSRTGASAALLVCVVAVAGCSGASDKAVTLPPATPAPSATPSMTPTASATPVGDKAQIEALVRSYYAAIDTAAAGDLGPLKKLSVGCEDCQRLVHFAEDLAAKHEKTIGLHYVVDVLSIPQVAGGQLAGAQIDYHVTAYKIVDEHGKTIETFGVDRGNRQVLQVVKRGGSWQIVGSKRLS